jgi:hypothetical protein
MLFAYPYRGDRMRIWGNVPFLTAGVIFIEGSLFKGLPFTFREQPAQ